MNKFSLIEFLKCGAFCKIDDEHIAFGYGKKTPLKTPSEKKLNWFYSDYFLKKESPFFTFETEDIIPLNHFKSLIPIANDIPNIQFKESSFAGFQEAFDSGIQLIKENKLQKAVPYHLLEGEGECSLLHLINAALNAEKGMPYGVWEKGVGMVGVTPERLFQIDESNILKTMAVAGTLGIQEENKLNEEHQLVIDGILNEIEGVSEVGPTVIKSFGSLSHLVTPITIQMSEKYSPYDLIKKLHPTAALGTFPKKPGLQWLLDCDKEVPRNYYGAPFGVISKKISSIVVAIRGVFFDKKKYSIYAGAGILKESVFSAELLEIKEKLASIRSTFHV